jgi:branched-subunit amino acid aminotransferase/4-amino-4-deoxychorismate lyase
MPEHNYICLKGVFKKDSEPSFFPANRAFRYGDALHENIHACATAPQFLGYHLERLFENMRLLSMEVPAFFSADFFTQLITQLLNKNRQFGGARIRLTVFRDTVEDFVPEQGRISFLLESQPLAHDHYALNEKGLIADICPGFTKHTGPLSHVHDAHALLYLLAAIEGRKNSQDEVVMLNEAGRIVETPDSNIFLVSGDSVFTPDIRQGCIPGVMRRVVTELAGAAGYRVNDQSRLTPAALDDAEEVFLTNAVDGIRWVGAFHERRYYKRMAKILTGLLNERAFNRI